MFLAKPGFYTPVQPPIVLGELPPCPSGISVIVAPADDDWVEVIDEIGEGDAGLEFPSPWP